MPASVEYFGIRHHGPGSARCLEQALHVLKPSMVLIEGPADAEELLPLLAECEMIPPVAMLAYDSKDAANAVFWPYAEFSPEYRAIRYAQENNLPIRLIDLPAANTLLERKEEMDALEGLLKPEPEEESAEGEASDDSVEQSVAIEDELDETTTSLPVGEQIRFDPIGALARAAGYEDGESWWSDLIEENADSSTVFAAVAEAMTELRSVPMTLPEREARREAHMRIAIAQARNETEGPIAVVCGAWHVPALMANHKLKDDRALLKGLPKIKPALTWAPWTEPRLASGSGYGAGVRYPGWYKHLWRHGADTAVITRWLLRMAEILRKGGNLISTASVIEAERLAVALASIRERPSPNFEEIRDAAIACMCHGEALLYQTISSELLIGSGVGQISANTPLAPLLDDLKEQQKKAKLKPEALDRELAVDLRSESGLLRSTLLHRLTALDIPWGRLSGSGRSRGTFRENWVLRWEPEYAVKLVEQLVHGPTIEQAAAQRVIMDMRSATTLAQLAELLRTAMTAQLPHAINDGIALLSKSATNTSDCTDLLRTLEPMAEVLRYGEARGGSKDFLADIVRKIALQSFLALPYAVRDLDADAATELSGAMLSAQRALSLIDLAPGDLEDWHQALHQIVDQSTSTASIAGLAARLLYEAELIDANEAALHLRRRLSPGTVTTDAAGYFEGFLGGISERLVHDEPLLHAVDEWIMDLSEEDLTANLPLFRRVFSGMDKLARQRLVDAVVRPHVSAGAFYELAEDLAPWEAHFPTVLDILQKGARDG